LVVYITQPLNMPMMTRVLLTAPRKDQDAKTQIAASHFLPLGRDPAEVWGDASVMINASKLPKEFTLVSFCGTCRRNKRAPKLMILLLILASMIPIGLCQIPLCHLDPSHIHFLSWIGMIMSNIWYLYQHKMTQKLPSLYCKNISR